MPRLTRALYALGQMNRFAYSRVVMSQLYFPKDSVHDVFVARIPIDEGVANIGDFEIIADIDTKSLVVVAKRQNVLETSTGTQTALEPTAQTEPELELVYDRSTGYSRL